MSRSEQKTQTRQRMLDAAARGFRARGYGAGVDSLAGDAGVTSGAFYKHFGSKADAFTGAVQLGMAELAQGIAGFQQQHGQHWWPEFVRFYLGPKRTCELAAACSLPTLAPELARADARAREVFEAGLAEVSRVLLAGPRSPGAPRAPAQAMAALAALMGGVTMARAVGDGAMATQIVQALEAQLLAPPRGRSRAAPDLAAACRP